MSKDEKDELIQAQKEVIGILFEIIKRLQENNNLDEEYFQLISTNKAQTKKKRVEEILKERKENGEIVGKLLSKLEI